MHAEAACPVVFEKALQRKGHGTKGQFIPGNLLLAKKGSFQRFSAWIVAWIREQSPEDDKHLIDIRNADHAIQYRIGKAGIGFLPGFTQGAFLDTFAILHEAGRKGPQPILGFNGPATKQDTPCIIMGKATDHKAWILIMHHGTNLAYMAFPVVPGRYHQLHWLAAGGAKFHDCLFSPDFQHLLVLFMAWIV